MSEEHITDSEAWLELGEGATATVIGKLDFVAFDNTGLGVRFADWSSLNIDTPDRGALALFEDNRPQQHPRWRNSGMRQLIPTNSYVHVRVERTENGVRGLAIWRPGGVPIPLVTPN